MGAFEKLRTLDIEYRISADISQTLNFFSFTLPNMIASLYALSTLLQKKEVSPCGRTTHLPAFVMNSP